MEIIKLFSKKNCGFKLGFKKIIRNNNITKKIPRIKSDILLKK
jgi:hypothetical protein